MQILDRREQVLRNKTIPLVKVLWRSHSVEEATWEHEEMMKRHYPHLFDAGTNVLNFEEEILIRGGELQHPKIYPSSLRHVLGIL